MKEVGKYVGTREFQINDQTGVHVRGIDIRLLRTVM